MRRQCLAQPISVVVAGCPGVDVLQGQTEDSSQLPTCNLSTMPMELQIKIFTLAIDGNESRLITLSSVCRLWRNILVNTQTLWKHLTVSKKTIREKVNTWLQRAGGTFSGLRLMDEFDFDTLPGLFGSVAARIWSSLEQLEIRSEARDATLLLSIVYKELRLRCLILNIDRPSREFWDDAWAMDVSRMQEFQVETWLGQVPIADSRFTGLVTLQLRGEVDDSGLLAVLERNPMLETLSLYGRPRKFESSRHVELVNLTKLELSWGVFVVDEYLQCLSFPYLKALHLTHCTLEFSEAILAKTFTRLEELSLCGSPFEESALIALLQNARTLRKMVLKTYYEQERVAINSVLDALASRELGGGTPGTLCCPRLQVVHLVRIEHLDSRSVMAIVKARLPSTGTVTALEKSKVQPLPIVYLKIEDCPGINHESFPWFEANVPECVLRRYT